MKVCHICNMNSGKHLLGCWSADHIKDIEQQLAAANARVAELEEKCEAQNDAIRIMENSIADDMEKTRELEQRAEQAESQCAAMRFRLREMFCPGGTECEECNLRDSCADKDLMDNTAGTALLEENKRMREALEEIKRVIGSQQEFLHQIINKALEG